MSTVEFLYLSQEKVIAAGGLDMAAAMADVEATLRLHHAGDDVLPLNLGIDVADGTRLPGAARGIGLGVEVEHHLLATKIRQAHFRTIIGRQREFWRCHRTCI